MAGVIGPTLIGTDRGTAGSELELAYKKKLIRRQANRAVFVTLLMGNVFGVDRPAAIPAIRHEAADNGYFTSWYETTRLSPTVTVSTDANSSQKYLACYDCSAVTACHMLRVIANGGGVTGEILYVYENFAGSATQLGNAGTDAVARGQFGSTAGAINAGATLLRLATAIPETSVTSVGARAGTRTEHFCTTQEVWTEMDMSKRRRATREWYGWDWTEDQKDREADHLEEIERMMFFNPAAQKSALGPNTSKLLITSAGLDAVISTHRFDAQGNCTYEKLIDYLGVMVRANAGNECRWIVLAGQRLFNHIAMWGEKYFMTRPLDDAFGITYGAIKIPTYGNLLIYYCPVLDTTHYSDGCFIVDTNPEILALRYLVEGPPDTGRSWDIAITDRNSEWQDITAIGSMDKHLGLRSNIGLEANDQARHGVITRFCTSQN